MLSVWQPANTAFDLWQWFPTVVPLLLLTDQVSQDKISRCWWGAASSTVDFWFPFPGHLPSHLAEGKQNRSLFPPCFRTSLKFPWHQQNLGGGGENSGSVCRKTPPSPLVALLTSRHVLRAWPRIFQPMALPSIYTLRSYIPFVKIISWSRGILACVM